MNRDEMLQRFYKVPGKLAYETDELVFDHVNAHLIFRETEKQVRDRRISKSQWVVTMGLGQFILFSILTFVPILYLCFLSIAFAAIGFWGIRWVTKHQVFEEQQKVYFGIDAQSQKIICLQNYDEKQREFNIDQIRNFYVSVESDSDSTLYYLRCTYGKDDKEVTLNSSMFYNHGQIVHYARLLGFLCDKSVLGYKISEGKFRPFKKDTAFP